MSRKRECPFCGKRFGLFRLRFRAVCGNCGQDLCYQCRYSKPEEPELLNYNIFNDIPDLWCPSCDEQKIGSIVSERLERYDNSLKLAREVTCYSHRYRGQIRFIAGDSRHISSLQFRDRDEAEHNLKINAAYFNYDTIANLHFERETENDGNYQYTVWRASGDAGKHA